MIFDKLCGIAERHFPDLAEVLRKAHLFFYDKPAHTLPKEHPVDRIAWLQENFFLPFPVVAAEDPASCLFYMDQSPNARGLSSPRTFVECCPLAADPSAFRDGHFLDGRVLDRLPEGACLISQGTLAFAKSAEAGYRVVGEVTRIFGATKKEIAFSMSGNECPDSIIHGCLRNAACGIEELMMLNTPDRFVLEIAPARARSPEGKKIPRSDDRPRYTILHPHEIRKVMGLPEPSGEKRGSPRPHERRAHTRTFRSERYKEAKGRTVIVPATWVGPSESVYQGRRYKVRLDL